MANVVVGLALLAFWLYCLFDVITTPAEQVRGLPKGMWVLITVIPALGGLLWLLAGRPSATPAPPAPPQPPQTPPRGPDDDPEFLRNLERRLRDED
ncbi:PLDc N-terminal domain-containing protein [Acrocarpospora catenulata]|uniref:PLDc N-terminal domain-containing protein n=1 Tax=Acrocarpospora catenulata TaxID=2836182 RepID=UPI001BD96891|nr:PLDc N-terminal domain-containing protein [Acrocarpospora catenulata]